MIRRELRNQEAKHHSQKIYSSRLIHPQKEYFFISSNLPELASVADIVPAFLTDHSPLLISLSKFDFEINGNDL